MKNGLLSSLASQLIRSARAEPVKFRVFRLQQVTIFEVRLGKHANSCKSTPPNPIAVFNPQKTARI